jgi:hypothetical protein
VVPSELLPTSVVSIELGISAERLRRILQARGLGQVVAGKYFVDRRTVEVLRIEVSAAPRRTVAA